MVTVYVCIARFFFTVLLNKDNTSLFCGVFHNVMDILQNVVRWRIHQLSHQRTINWQTNQDCKMFQWSFNNPKSKLRINNMMCHEINGILI